MRSVLTRDALGRLALGWGVVLALSLLLPHDTSSLPIGLVLALLAGIVGIILVCAFGVVHQAEQLATRLGDPYGTLVLTISIGAIEVALIAAMMLGPGDHTTIARDSIMAVSMIILNLVVGLSLLLGGLRYGTLAANRTGVTTYLVLATTFCLLAFALPDLVGSGGAYTPPQEIVVVMLTLGLYAFFLSQQLGARAGDFQEVAVGSADGHACPGMRTAKARSGSAEAEAAGTRAGAGDAKTAGDAAEALPHTWADHRSEILLRTAVLIATVLPIVLMGHAMAALVDDVLERSGAPVALAGVLVAMIVFTPETLTSLRAALDGETQRVMNLCHGAMVGTTGTTIPVVLLISALTGQHVVFAESAVNLILLAVTLAVSALTFLGPRATAVHGAVHLGLFATYALTLFA